MGVGKPWGDRGETVGRPFNLMYVELIMKRILMSLLYQARLAKEVLAEIPDQLVSFMRSRGIKPGTGNAGGASSGPPATAPDISGFLKMQL